MSSSGTGDKVDNGEGGKEVERKDKSDSQGFTHTTELGVP